MGEVTNAAAPGTLHRRDAVARLLEDRGDLLVVTGLGSPTYDTFAAGDHPGNFYLWGAMGGAAMTGLGIALAQPERPVAVITGDGEQLMGLGALATIAVQKPANLSIVVLDNGHYGETGGQLSHSGAGVDLAQVARAVGIAEVLDVKAAGDLAAARNALHAKGAGPKVIVVRIVNEETSRALPTRDGGYLKDRFRAHLGFVPQ
ncbi:MAG: thiamine pyrophosphate-dependent enzyme [Novosphingobium sp.]|nr:thiamine pyrophosphate-dependent enzyme [Novosphingobium sp.]